MFPFPSDESKTQKYIFLRVEERYFEYFYLLEKERIFYFFIKFQCKFNTILNKKIGDWK